MSAAWIAPVAVIGYLFLVFMFSDRMAYIFNTSYIGMIILGFLFPPIWILMGIVALFYGVSGKTTRPKRVEVVNKKKSPKRKARKTK